MTSDDLVALVDGELKMAVGLGHRPGQDRGGRADLLRLRSIF